MKLQYEVDLNMNVSGRVLEKNLEGDPNTEVISVAYDLENLVIKVRLSGGHADVIFNRPGGFRVLDEGDLVEFWYCSTLKDGWLFEIISGGWKDLEATRPGFLTSTQEDAREYLITGINDCVSIITYEEPVIECVLPVSAHEIKI